MTPLVEPACDGVSELPAGVDRFREGWRVDGSFLQRLGEHGVRSAHSPFRIASYADQEPTRASHPTFHVHHGGATHAKAPLSPPADPTSAGGFVFGVESTRSSAAACCFDSETFRFSLPFVRERPPSRGD